MIKRSRDATVLTTPTPTTRWFVRAQREAGKPEPEVKTFRPGFATEGGKNAQFEQESFCN